MTAIDYPDDVVPGPKPGATPAGVRWMPVAALVLAVIAVGLAIGAWFRPAPTPSYSDQQVADAKTDVCAAFKNVRKSVSVSTNPPHPDTAAAVNARLAWFGGASDLRGHLSENPATPSDIAGAIRALARSMDQLGLSYLAESPDSQKLLKEFNGQLAQITDMCGT